VELPDWARKARTGWQAFQQRQGLPADGLPGLKTLARAEALEGELQATTEPPPAPSTYSFGGAPIRTGVDRDPMKLHPAFAAKIELLFQCLRDKGFEPLLWEGFRSFERAEQLARRGTGIRQSMHCYKIAGDIVDSDDTPWTAPPGFWETMRDKAEELGLTVLYRNGKPRTYPTSRPSPCATRTVSGR